MVLIVPYISSHNGYIVVERLFGAGSDIFKTPNRVKWTAVFLFLNMAIAAGSIFLGANKAVDALLF